MSGYDTETNLMIGSRWIDCTCILNIDKDVCETPTPPPPFPQYIKNRIELWPTDLNINRNHLLIKDHLPTKFEASGAKRSWLLVAQGVRDQHDLWLTDLNTNRDHLLMMDYLPTKFEASGPKRSWVISCTRLREIDVPTDRQTYRRTCAKQHSRPSSKGGGGHKNNR